MQTKRVPGIALKPLTLSSAEREKLELIARRPKTSQRDALRARIVLLAAAGEPNLRWKDGVLVFSGTPLVDLDKALEKHRSERLKNLRS